MFQWNISVWYMCGASGPLSRGQLCSVVCVCVWGVALNLLTDGPLVVNEYTTWMYSPPHQ